MSNKLFESMFKNMSYDTYKKLEIASFFSPGVANLANYFIDSRLTSCSLEVFSILSCVYFCSTTLSYAENWTQDIVKIRNLYNELLDEYAILLDSFDLTHPMEIYSMYNFMLHNGYLSINDKFSCVESDVRDINKLLGVNVVTGKAMCRHVSSLLSDIYNKVGIDSQVLPVHFDPNEVLKNEINELILMLEVETKTIQNTNEQKQIEELINVYREKLKEIKPKFEPLKKKKCNHLITLSSFDGNCYLLDSINNAMYRKDTRISGDDVLDSYIISSKTGMAKICKRSFSLFDLKKEETRSRLLLPDSNDLDDKIIINNTNKLCSENLDLIDSFKNEHKSLYNELNNSIFKIKRRKK